MTTATICSEYDVDDSGLTVSSPSACWKELLARCEAMGASDLHVTSGVRPYVRVEGVLEPLADQRLEPELVEAIVDQLVSGAHREILGTERSVDLAFFSDSGARFRVNIFYQRGSAALAVRRLDNSFRSLEDLHLPHQISELSGFTHGLVIVTGPTGSGKSTTLATLIHQINTQRACHIIMVEDPIEYVHENRQSLVQQRQLYTDVPSFASAVRAALREDPDVLLVGEMRDLATMRAAITAAETGHLVFSTLHTGDAVGSIDRMITSFTAEEQPTIRAQLSRVLRAVVAQCLVRRKGAPGRVPVVEIMRLNPAVRNLIRTGQTQQIHTIMQTCGDEGMYLLEQSLAELVARDLIDLDEARRIARDANVLDARLSLIPQAMRR